MSVAYNEPRAPARPLLRIIHSQPVLEEPEPVAAGAPVAVGQQDELPLQWASDLGARRTGLGQYPTIPLLPGTPRPEPAIAHVSRLLVEVLAGTRPATQLSRWATLDEQQRLARRTALRQASKTWAPAPARVSSTSAMVVGESVVQVVVVFFLGRRAHGAAVRMEFRHGRWLITDVQTPA